VGGGEEVRQRFFGKKLPRKKGIRENLYKKKGKRGNLSIREVRKKTKKSTSTLKERGNGKKIEKKD